MKIQERTTRTIEATPKRAAVRTSTIINLNLPSEAVPDPEPKSDTKVETPLLFRNLAPTTLAERYPLLTFLAVSLVLLASALFTEIEFLKGSGYFWD